jgi:hypothetical protein
MSNARINLRAEGASPLLMNRMPEAALLNLWRKDRKTTGAQGRAETPRDEAATRLYADKEGFYIPAICLMSALTHAGVFMKLDGKRQISTAKSSLLGGMLQIEQTHLRLDTPGWEVDIQQGRNPNGGEAVCIIRPRFDKWAFDASVIVDLEQLPATRYRELFDLAGTRVGLLDFRPQKKGTYGRFRYTRFDVEELAQ